MTANIETAVIEALRQIAPDVDMASIDRDGDLREEFDIDSMDFLNLVTALSDQLAVPMPETDYPSMMSFNAMKAYLERRA